MTLAVLAVEDLDTGYLRTLARLRRPDEVLHPVIVNASLASGQDEAGWPWNQQILSAVRDLHVLPHTRDVERIIGRLL